MGPRWVGDGDGDGGDGIIFPVHPSPIPNVPRDNISRKGIPHSDLGTRTVKSVFSQFYEARVETRLLKKPCQCFDRKQEMF